MTDEWSDAARDARLREHLAYAYARAPAVRELFDCAGVDPGAVHGLADLAALPVTSKDGLLRRQTEDPPFGGFCAVPIEDLGRVYVCPGPIYEPAGVWDDANWIQELLAAHGMPRRGRALISFSYHLVPAGLGLDATLRRYGLVVVPAGVGNTDVQARVLRDLAVEVFCGTLSFLVTLLERAEAMGSAGVRSCASDSQSSVARRSPRRCERRWIAAGSPWSRPMAPPTWACSGRPARSGTGST
jgi:phenylacetate-CoA ligase